MFVAKTWKWNDSRMPAALAAVVMLALFAVPGVQAQPSVWKLDREQSSIQFVAGSRLGDVPGVFHKWSADIAVPADLSKATGTIVVQVESIDTKNRRRDDHLRNPDFFDVAKFPTAKFVIKSVEDSEDSVRATGQFTIHGVAKTETIRFRKEVADNVMTLKGQVVIDRFAYGITYDSIFNPIEQQIPLKLSLRFTK